MWAEFICVLLGSFNNNHISKIINYTGESVNGINIFRHQVCFCTILIYCTYSKLECFNKLGISI